MNECIDLSGLDLRPYLYAPYHYLVLLKIIIFP